MIVKHENTIFTGNLNPALISQIIINKYKLSPIIQEMRIADRYYDAHNEIIEKKRRVYFDKDRKPIENPNANNAKIKNNFLRTLVQHKQDYEIIVSPRCPKMIESLSNYAWKKDRMTDKIMNEPDHEFSHAPDALRYGCEELQKFGIQV